MFEDLNPLDKSTAVIEIAIMVGGSRIDRFLYRLADP